MILNIQGITPCSQSERSSRQYTRETYRRSTHSGHDPRQQSLGGRSESAQLPSAERHAASAIEIDMELLTGDLDQDIAILSVVA